MINPGAQKIILYLYKRYEVRQAVFPHGSYPLKLFSVPLPVLMGTGIYSSRDKWHRNLSALMKIGLIEWTQPPPWIDSPDLSKENIKKKLLTDLKGRKPADKSLYLRNGKDITGINQKEFDKRFELLIRKPKLYAHLKRKYLTLTPEGLFFGSILARSIKT